MEDMHKLLFNIVLWTSVLTQDQMDPDFGLSSEELIKKYQYPFEKYTLQTEDGYFLEVHRIPNTKFNNTMKNVPPILLYSGFLGDSSTWITLGPKRGLGFILADNGYDVWMGNNRGTTLCKKHISLDPVKDKKKFWDFSFQEMGYYDIPVTIDFILNTTQQEQLIYIGYSQGTSSYFAMLSEKPNYNNKIKFAIALAPVATLRNCLSVFVRVLSQIQKNLLVIVEEIQKYELLPHTETKNRAVIKYCSPNSFYHNICANILCTLFGGTIEQINKTTLPLILSNSPAGTSVREGFHLLQLFSGVFRKYDFGKEKNLLEYGQEIPPNFNLSKIITPLAIIYGSYDTLVSQKDVRLLAPKLPNLVRMKLIPKFNHVDLSLGIDAPRLVFSEILKLLKMYS